MSILIRNMAMPEKGHILSVVIKDSKVIAANTGKVLSKEVLEIPDVYIDIAKAFMTELTDKVCRKEGEDG